MKALSLFSNVGIGEIYLKDIGIDVCVANELHQNRCEMYQDLHPSANIICGDITKQSIKDKIYEACLNNVAGDGVDLIIATPPCQGMSVANAKRLPDDYRNSLIIHAMSIFNKILPKYMLIENVAGMSNTFINNDGKVINIIKYIESQIPEPWVLNWEILNAKDYNTPQSRKRFIGLISRYGDWKHPKPSKKLITTRDAIKHLPSLESEEKSSLPWHYAKKHNDNHILWMKHTPTGETAFNNKTHFPQKDGRKIKGFATTYKRIDWDKPAPTVTMCNGAVSSQNNVHPGNLKSDGTYSDARVMSVRELMILCGLPENLFDTLAEKYSENFMRKVLGECFPPKMCLEIIKNIKKI